LRESSDPVLRLETDGRGTIIRGERSEFRLPAENPDEFPTVAEFTESGFLEVPARLLRELIRRTVFATDNESSRYALGGVLLEYGNGELTAVGTDGRRLAVMKGPAGAIGGYRGTEGNTIVPTRAMQFIERTITDGDTEVQLASRGNDVLLKTPRAVIYSRLVEGRFPKWRDVFPKRTDAHKIPLVVGPAYSAVRQAAIVTSDESRGVDFTFGEGKLVLSGRAAETGQSRVELPIAYDGPTLSIALDPRYVNDFFRVLDPEKNFTLEIKDSDSAAILSTDDGYGYVVMPLARDK
jgi:DNA polymerase-3 subunit beta